MPDNQTDKEPTKRFPEPRPCVRCPNCDEETLKYNPQTKTWHCCQCEYTQAE